jgi:hypothetical protein
MKRELPERSKHMAERLAEITVVMNMGMTNPEGSQPLAGG